MKAVVEPRVKKNQRWQHWEAGDAEVECLLRLPASWEGKAPKK